MVESIAPGRASKSVVSKSVELFTKKFGKGRALLLGLSAPFIRQPAAFSPPPSLGLRDWEGCGQPHFYQNFRIFARAGIKIDGLEKVHHTFEMAP